MKNYLIPKNQLLTAPLEEISRVLQELDKIPDFNTMEDIPNYFDRPVYAHYFYGGCDWFVHSIDEKYKAYFGFAIINQDYQLSELGSFFIDDLINYKKVELDFYWQVKTLEECLLSISQEYYQPIINRIKNQ